jgi:ubiquinone/menaquinone biosynthesis C-methylase UbiE
MNEHMLASKSAVQDFWNSEACGERYGNQQDRMRYQLEPEILSFANFGSVQGLRVLEIGVGMGSDTVRFASAGAKVTGIDLSSRAVEITRRRLREMQLEADIHLADAEELPFPDESFDVVYSWGVLHHTPNTATALSEAQRVVRRDGRLKLMLYHRRSWVALAAWVRFGVMRGRPLISLKNAIANIESPATQAFTEREVRAMLPGIRQLSVRSHLTIWDRRVAPGISGLTGNRLGWFLLVSGTK